MPHRFSQFSSLLLSDEENPAEAHHLSVRELQNTNYQNLRFVLIGACEQGLTGNRYGNNFESIAVSFLENGTNAAIAPLWSVLSKPTVDIGTKILERFIESGSASQAYCLALKKAKDDSSENVESGAPLARAQTSTHRNYHDNDIGLPSDAPIFWAGLTLWGC